MSKITKAELRRRLENGEILGELLRFGPGQECEIYKAEEFEAGDVVLYVPDIYLNTIPIDKPIMDREQLDDILGCCYTGDEIIRDCGGDMTLAERIFCFCDWQHPSSAYGEWGEEDET